MKCLLTGNEGKGINAHIIPKSFYSIYPEETLPNKMLTDADGHYPKRCPIGIYDNTIVTVDGERIFSEWDDYAADLLIYKKSCFKPLSQNGEIIAFQIADYNYTKLKLFFLSVLWRASVSNQHFFQKVDLGPHESVIREALLSGDPHDSDWFAVSISKWSDHDKGATMLDPYRTRFDGINYYVMYLEYYIVYCKVDKRIPGRAFKAIQLQPNRPLTAVARELGKSKELPILVNMVNKHAK